MRFYYLLCLCFLVCCQGREQVEVTGAVVTPGRYAYVPEWQAADYVQGAGGYTSEAWPEKTHLMRAVSKIAQHKDFEMQSLALEEVTHILPDDRVVVPAKTYSVRLDSVRLVKQVILEVADEIFKMDSGALVSGYIDHGAVVAMLMGPGQIYESSDTTQAISVFHYLFVHFHPKEYDRVLSFAGDQIDSLEALEDAQVVFDRVFPLRKYQVDQQAELPPASLFEVIPGLWARPKHNEVVGDDLRKRRFGDGRIWTVFPDGRHRWQFPDGRVEVFYDDGRKETRFGDGRVEIVEAQSSRAYVGQGESRKKGSTMIQRENGDLFMREADGTERTVFAEGGASVRHPDGHVVTQYPGGQIETVYPDGRRVIRAQDGQKENVFTEDRRVVKRADGASLVEYADGRRIRRWPDGHAIETFPDGRVVTVTAIGHRTEVFPDGRRRLTLPEDYAYPGRLRPDLAAVDDLPNRVDVDGIFQVNGRLLESVETVEALRVAAFMVPDGVVIDGDLTRQGDAFSARFQFKEEGHCRVQVQVRLPGARTFTVSHQAIVVGNPKPLAPVFFDVVDYPGNEQAHLYLIDEINQSRRKVGKMPVMPHPELMRVAQIRLQEMMQLGEVSHFSAEGYDANWHAKRLGIGLRQVGENVANGQVLEVLHPHWMSSAGHRKNVLFKDWTHVGVAVVQRTNDVWAVEIFGR